MAANFHHPFEPYDIQRDFMTALYQCLEDGKVGIFESPTGTGKSLSLICGSLTWLRDHKRKQFEASVSQAAGDGEEPDWMVEHELRERRRKATHRREELEVRLRHIREKEERMKQRMHNGEPSSKRLKSSHDASRDDDEAAFLLNDYESDDESTKNKHETNGDGNSFSTETQALLSKLGMSLKSDHASEEEDDLDDMKIFYCSRTHSQLTQFANELRRVRLPPVIAPETGDGPSGGGDSIADLEEDIKQVTLGSRKNLCINAKVSRLSNAAAINERCLELQDKKTGSEDRCQYLPTKENEASANDFRDHALAKIRDIEDLGALGKKLGICPYYASRAAVKPSEIVTLPYPLLLQKSAREALDISLKNHVVIIDEAHNLMDAVAGMYSVTTTRAQLKLAHAQLMMYLQRFRNRLKGKNRVYVAQTVRLLDSVFACLDKFAAHRKPDEVVVTASDLTAGKGVDQINLYKLSRYLQESKLARKVDRYIIHSAKQDKQSGSSTPASKTTPALMHVQNFLLTLMNPSAEGRFFASVNQDDQGVEIRYMLLDPTSHFQHIVEEARAVVLAGGTMSPMNDYTQHLFSYLNPEQVMTLSCGHVIPSTNLLAYPVTKAPSGSDFDFTFEKRMLGSTINDLGHAISSFAKAIPDGLVVFFPSYEYLDHCVKVWQSKSLGSNSSNHWQRLQTIKPVFKESQSKPASDSAPGQANHDNKAATTESLLTAYSTAITSSTNRRGALLLAVIGGTLSEGINFSDSLGRGIAVVGLPFSNPHSAEWKAKMEFIAGSQGKDAARDFYTNACMRAVNQAVGRAIRHRDDYAAILLLDRRYGTKGIQDKLPGWIKESLQKGTGIEQVVQDVSKFFEGKRSV